MTRRQFQDAFEESLRRGRGQECKEMIEGLVVHGPRQPGVGQQALYLRGKKKRVRRECIIERLHTQSVARQKQASLALVPDGEGEHAAHALHAFHAILLIKMDDHFGIRVRPETVSARLQLGAEFGKIVGLAIVGNPNCAVLIAEWLPPGRRKVDDGESSVCQADPTIA